MNISMLQISHLFIGLLFLLNTTIAQPQIEWIYHYGTPESELGIKVIQTNDGGYVTAGYEEVDPGNRDWLIHKVDASGDIQWQKNLGTSQYTNIAYDIKQTSDNGFVLTGSLSDTGTGDENFVLVKLDSQGVIEWQQFYELYLPFANSLSLTADDGYIIAGNSNGLSANNQSDGLFRKLDAQGNLEWEQQYGGSLADEIFSIQQTNDLGYIATGHSSSFDGDIEVNQGDHDIWVIKMNPAGELEWSNTFGGSQEDVSRSIQESSDGGFLIAGYTSSADGDVGNSYGDEDIWLIKLDINGNLLWEKNYGGGDEDRAQAITKVSTGGFVVSGWSRSDDGDLTENRGLIDVWIFKIDDGGTLKWEKNFGGSGIDQSFDIKETTDGGFIATGNTFSSNGDFNQNSGSGDLWVMKLSPLSVGLSEENYVQTINVFPNPNSGQFSINASNINSSINIRIYDLQGRNIYTKTNADIRQPISIDSKSKGLYIIELTGENKIYFEKLIID